MKTRGLGRVTERSQCGAGVGGGIFPTTPEVSFHVERVPQACPYPLISPLLIFKEEEVGWHLVSL